MSKRKTVISLISSCTLAIGLLIFHATTSQAITQVATFAASDASANAHFGTSVAIAESGTLAIVGNQQKTVGGSTVPSTAYVFTKTGTTWSQTAILSASDGLAADSFGFAVAISGDGTTAAIGAPSKKVGTVANVGTVYIFSHSGSGRRPPS